MAVGEEMGVTGTPETGYYRDPRARGLKTGRVSPRVPIRMPARDRIALANGLYSPGDVDMNQGMLFHPDDVKPVATDAEMAEAEGVPRLRPSSMPGFMPGLTGSPGGQVSAHAQKINALRAFTGNSVLEDNTIRGAMDSVQSHLTPGVTKEWYEGQAADSIMAATHAANAHLEKGNINAHQMRRGVAYFSAQRPWDTGNAQDGSYRVSNVTNVAGMPKFMEEGGNPEDYKISAYSRGFPVAGEMAQPQTKQVQQKAGEIFAGSGSAEETGAPHASDKDKVATFDSGLGFGLVRSLPARRHLSNAMVIDTHQAKAAGQENYDVVANTVGGYDVTAMVNRRAILREGVRDLNAGLVPRLPIRGQSDSWEDVRPEEADPKMSLFVRDNSGNFVPNDFDKVDKWSASIKNQMVEGRPQPKKKS